MNFIYAYYKNPETVYLSWSFADNFFTCCDVTVLNIEKILTNQEFSPQVINTAFCEENILIVHFKDRWLSEVLIYCQ